MFRSTRGCGMCGCTGIGIGGRLGAALVQGCVNAGVVGLAGRLGIVPVILLILRFDERKTQRGGPFTAETCLDFHLPGAGGVMIGGMV
jgi:hypothetical protein